MMDLGILDMSILFASLNGTMTIFCKCVLFFITKDTDGNYGCRKCVMFTLCVLLSDFTNRRAKRKV